MAIVNDLTEGLQILNEIQDAEGFTDAPEITAENLENIGVLPHDTINKYNKRLNLTLEQRFFRMLFDASDNPWREYFWDLTENGWGILDVFTLLADSRLPYFMANPDKTPEEIAADLVSYKGDNLKSKYHTTPIGHQSYITIDDKEYKKMYTKFGLPRYINDKFGSMGSKIELDLQNDVISIFKDMVDNKKLVIKGGYEMQTAEGIKTLVEDMRAIMHDMTLPSTKNNGAGVYNRSNPEDLRIITTPDKMERVRVRDLAGAFNMSEADIKGKIIYAPIGTDLGKVNGEDTLFIVADKRVAVVGLNVYQASDQYVPNMLYTNYFLSCQGVKGSWNIFNGVAFTGTFDEYTG